MEANEAKKSIPIEVWRKGRSARVGCLWKAPTAAFDREPEFRGFRHAFSPAPSPAILIYLPQAPDKANKRVMLLPLCR